MEYLEGKSLDKLLDEEFGRGTSFSHAWPIIGDVGAACRPDSCRHQRRRVTDRLSIEPLWTYGIEPIAGGVRILAH